MTEHTSSYYAASANKYAPFDTLNESISCDVCVVGGGYTGLSSALHLAEAGFDVVVLEAATSTSSKKATAWTPPVCSAA